MKPGMKKFFGAVIIACLAAGASYYLYRNQGRHAGVHTASAIYYCPMHPNYRSDKPGNCPICDMKLVKLEGASVANAMIPEVEPQASPEKGIYIAPERQQLVGMKSVVAKRMPLTKEIRAAGRVSADERHMSHIHTKVAGYVEEVFVDFVGKQVNRGDPVFTIYSPELVATEQEYLLALKSRRTLKDSSYSWISDGSANLLEAARKRLELWDVTAEEIRTLEQEGKVKRAITVYSPVSGVVTDRKAYHHGTFVSPEMDLFTLVDLSHVWVLADVQENDLQFVRVGQMAEVEFPFANASRKLRGRVEFISPFLDPKTRTAQARLEFANPNLDLKPDMYTSVTLHIGLGNRIVVPRDAVLDTGTEQYVFIDKGDGYVQPRLVKESAEMDENAAIESGLEAGERVVTGANFLVDSESRLKSAFANLGKPAEVVQHTGLSIQLLDPKEAVTGTNFVDVAVKDSGGAPMTDAEVEIEISMPAMGSMPPMMSKAVLHKGANGDYVGTLEVPMAWSWQTTITVRRGGVILGRTQTTLRAH